MNTPNAGTMSLGELLRKKLEDTSPARLSNPLETTTRKIIPEIQFNPPTSRSNPNLVTIPKIKALVLTRVMLDCSLMDAKTLLDSNESQYIYNGKSTELGTPYVVAELATFLRSVIQTYGTLNCSDHILPSKRRNTYA